MLRFACILMVAAACAAQDHAERAVQFVQQGDLRAAESELRQALEAAPNDPALLTSLGGILGMQGKLEQADVYLAKAVKLNPRDAAARRNLAANQWQLGRLQEAQANLDALLRANPRDPIATYLLGMVSEREAKYSRSIELLESMPEIAARQPEALVALASSYYHTGRPREGAAQLKTLLSRSAKPEVFFMAGRVAIAAHDNALAEHLLSAGIATGHAGEPAYLLLCRLLTDRAAYDPALEIAKQAVKAFPASHEALETEASIDMKLNYFTEAAASFKKAVSLHPSAGNQRDLALAEWRAGQKQQSTADFDLALRKYPHDPVLPVVYGTLLLEDGSPASRTRAIELFKRVIAAGDSSAEARYQLANIDLEDGKLESALQHLTAAIKLDPDASRLHFALSRVYRRLGRETDANAELAVYQKLKSAEPHP